MTTKPTFLNQSAGFYLRVVVILAVMGGVFWGIRSIGIEQLQVIVERAGWFAPVVYMLLRAFAGFVAPFSSGPLQLASGVLFGFWPALLYSVLGSTLGYSISFWLARRYGRNIVVRLVGDSIERVDEIISRLDSIRGLMTARLALYFAYDLVAYAAGLSKARFAHFLWVTLLLGIPPIALTVASGIAAVSGMALLPF